MSDADRSQYVEAVTTLSGAELQDIISVAEPPACLLGGWAVYSHVTDGFRDSHGRPYIGSRDIDLGVHVDPEWSTADLQAAPVATTLDRIEIDLGYSRGRFGFFRQYHRETGDRLTEEEARDYPAVSWTAPAGARIAPSASLAAMRIRAFPERDKSPKQLKDLADLHALLWHVEEYASMWSAARDRVSEDDVETFRAARLIEVDATIVQQSIEQLLV